ncbi:MAG: hypothetical protein ACTSQH_09170, partial [Candidatus Hodarchaeales archaeon]
MKYARKRKGTATIIGTTFFLVILLTVVANMVVYNQATIEMNRHLSNKASSQIRLEKVETPAGLSLRVTSLGSYDSKIIGLWIIGAYPDYHDYLSEETLETLVDSLIIPAGGSRNIEISNYPNYAFTGSVNYKVLTDLGNMAITPPPTATPHPTIPETFDSYWNMKNNALSDFDLLQENPPSSVLSEKTLF